jgi:hypothetical protein
MIPASEEVKSPDGREPDRGSFTEAYSMYATGTENAYRPACSSAVLKLRLQVK